MHVVEFIMDTSSIDPLHKSRKKKNKGVKYPVCIIKENFSYN
jgi:hypothetical protein